MGGQVSTDIAEQALLDKTDRGAFEVQRTPLEKVYHEISLIKRNIAAIEYTTKKLEVTQLLQDPVYYVQAMEFIKKCDAVGLRIWINQTLYGMIDFTVVNLRALCASYCIKGYAAMNKDQMLSAIVDYKKSLSELTEEEKEDAVIPEDVPGGYLNPLSPHRANLA